MSDYAIRHSPTVQARRQASGLPTLNSYQIGWWRQKALDLGLPTKGTKRDLYTRIMLRSRQHLN